MNPRRRRRRRRRGPPAEATGRRHWSTVGRPGGKPTGRGARVGGRTIGAALTNAARSTGDQT